MIQVHPWWDTVGARDYIVANADLWLKFGAWELLNLCFNEIGHINSSIICWNLERKSDQSWPRNTKQVNLCRVIFISTEFESLIVEPNRHII